MTSKKKRQRGSRTHGGGSHKNRRGAGHRGGRVHDELEVVADDFSADAAEALSEAGGEAVLSERGEELAAEAEEADRDTTDEANEEA